MIANTDRIHIKNSRALSPHLGGHYYCVQFLSDQTVWTDIIPLVLYKANTSECDLISDIQEELYMTTSLKHFCWDAKQNSGKLSNHIVGKQKCIQHKNR